MSPGTYRVIMRDNGKKYIYVGVTNKNPGVGDTVHAC